MKKEEEAIDFVKLVKSSGSVKSVKICKSVNLWRHVQNMQYYTNSIFASFVLRTSKFNKKKLNCMSRAPTAENNNGF